jgi:hypothetical protein
LAGLFLVGKKEPTNQKREGEEPTSIGQTYEGKMN